MHKFRSLCNDIFENIFGYVGIIMIFVATYGVFARTLLHISSPWIEEALKLLFVWSIFTCAGVAFLHKELIGLNLINEKFAHNKKITLMLEIVQNVIPFIFGLLCVIWSIDILSVQIMTGECTTVLQLPLWIINLGFLFGNLLIVIFAVVLLYRAVKQYQAK